MTRLELFTLLASRYEEVDLNTDGPRMIPQPGNKPPVESPVSSAGWQLREVTVQPKSAGSRAKVAYYQKGPVNNSSAVIPADKSLTETPADTIKAIIRAELDALPSGTSKKFILVGYDEAQGFARLVVYQPAGAGLYEEVEAVIAKVGANYILLFKS